MVQKRKSEKRFARLIAHDLRLLVSKMGGQKSSANKSDSIEGSEHFVFMNGAIVWRRKCFFDLGNFGLPDHLKFRNWRARLEIGLINFKFESSERQVQNFLVVGTFSLLTLHC